MRSAPLLTLTLMLGLALPGTAGAALGDFGAAGGGPSLSDVNEISPGGSTTLDLFFSTTGTDDPSGYCLVGPGCILGWTGTLSATGTLQIIGYDPTGNPNTATGPGETSCDPFFLPVSGCQTSGGNPGSGEVGTDIVMFSLTVSGGSPGDQLLYSGDFTLSDLSPHSITDQVLAEVPEPATLALLGAAMLGLALQARRGRPGAPWPSNRERD